MNSIWQEFLEQRNAEINDNHIVSFGDPQQERDTTASGHVIADLSAYGLIRAQGEDAETFLQNQFTNDVKLVSDTHSQISAYCSPKGRMLAIFRLFKRGDCYYLRLPRSILEATLKRLRMYILRSKVTLEDASDELVRLGFAGPEAPQKLASILKTVPAESNAVIQHDGITLIRLPGALPRYECHAEAETLVSLWQRLARQAVPVGTDCWHWLTIHAGVPEISPRTIDTFVPQMANLTALGGISFSKGCYPGQEVVARMHYLGKLKRRMYLAHVESTTLPLPGDNLYTSAEAEQSAGKVVQAQFAPGGGVDLLAVIQIASAEKEELHLESESGPVLKLLDLPYTVTNEA